MGKPTTAGFDTQPTAAERQENRALRNSLQAEEQVENSTEYGEHQPCMYFLLFFPFWSLKFWVGGSHIGK